PGSGRMLRASRPAAIMASARMIVPEKATAEDAERAEYLSCSTVSAFSAVAFRANDGSSISSADSAETMTITCSECDVPIQGMRMKLVTSDPAIAPTVFAAYTPPASRAASCSVVATAASASGKLAPHNTAPGSTTHRQRTKSSCIVNHGVVAIDGLIGQYGSDSVS